MNCSQLLERKAATNWEKPAFSPQSLEVKLNEIRAESRMWAALKPAAPTQASPRFDRTTASAPTPTLRWS